MSLNVGDSLALKCTALSTDRVDNGLAAIFALMFAPASNVNPTMSVTYTRGLNPTPLQAKFSVSGSLVYDSFYGVQSTWSHWLISDKISTGAMNGGANFGMPIGWLSFLVPSLISTDAGSLYCVFIDGGSTTASKISFSTALTLTLTTKSRATNHHGQNQPDKLFIRYSLLFLTASSKLFI